MSMNAMKESVTTIPSGSSLQVRFLQTKRHAPLFKRVKIQSIPLINIGKPTVKKITNLADTVISVERPNIRITKNREFGTLSYIPCNYDPANRRIFQANIGDRTVYGWNHEGITIPEDQASALPEFTVQIGKPAEAPPRMPF